MKGLAGLIMRGRLPAIAFIAGTSLLPFIAWLGCAAVSLVVLRRGVTEGGLVTGAAVLVLAALEMMFSGHPGGVISLLLLVWLPIFLTAAVLRATVSLPLALVAGTALAMVGVMLWHLMVQDPEAFWRLRLAGLEQDMGEAQFNQVMDLFGQYLATFMALGLWLNVLIGLLLGRAWQAALYNPGGFRQEFHALRLDWRLAAAALVIMLAATFAGPGLLNDMALLLAGLFAVQTLALVHAVVHGRGWNAALLVVPYVLLPVAFMAVALLGILDAWLDIRRRLLDKPAAGDG
ncbi:MAG: hypothetical protein WDZ65_11865 [Aquisalimonadaceae bacterium]